jgi:tetratricopeptide (TPR) repeat protein
VRKRKVVVAIAGQPALSFEDAAAEGETRGLVQVGATAGKVVLTKSLTLSGQVNPDYLKKKIGTVEMAARRSINKDLGEVKEYTGKQLANLILGGSAEGISADLLLIEFLTVQELPDYDRLKQWLTGSSSNPGETETLGKKLDEWLEKHPGFPSLWYLRGILHLRRAELVEARDKFAKAVALFPDLHEAVYQTAVTWQYAREFEKALEQTRKALEIRPDYANALMLQAQMRFAADKKAGVEADRVLRVAEKLGADTDEVLQLRRWVKMQTRGPRDLGCIYEWESPNYRIVTDISLDRAMWYADQLEIVRGTYLDNFKKWYQGDARPKPRIAIFNTREAFYTYSELSSTNRHENALGFFDPANNELVLFEDLDLNETLETLYHEAFHHFASAMLKFPPYWWNEGIAEYMSGVRIDPVKKAVKERARTLRGRLMFLQMALQNDFFVTFERIMNYTPSEFYSGPIGLHYAQAWAMLHFFYEFGGGRHRELIEKYFDELVGGKTQRQAYDDVFKGKTEQLEKDWLEFAKKLKPPATP